MGQNWSTLWTGKSRAYRGHAPQASAPGLHIQDPAYDDNEELIRPENWNWTLSLSLYLETPGASCTQRFAAADHQISVYNILLCKIPMSFKLEARAS